MTDSKPAKLKGRSKAAQTPPSMGENLTASEERFCVAYVETGHKIPSYRKAFEADHPDDRVIWRRVERLLTYPRILKEIERLKANIREKHDVTIESLLKELEEARKAALNAETAQASAAVAATMGKAKITGLEKSKLEVTGADGAAFMPSRIELVAPDVNSKG